RTIDPTATIPLLKDEPFIYFAPAEQDVVIDDLERVYDGGNIDRFRSPIDGSTIARSFRASEEDVAAARGVTVRVTSSDRQRTARVTLSNFCFHWPLTGDVPASGTVDVFATVRAPIEGVYRFRLDGPPGARLDL